MSRASQVCTVSVFLGCSFLLSLGNAVLPQIALASDVSCQFKATTETTEIHVIANGKTLWTGPVEKLQTKTVSIPEGPFTVISKVYNENLKTTGDIRTDTHTRQCGENTVLTVPLFQDSSRKR